MMKSDGVKLALELVLEEISAVVEQLNHEGMVAFGRSRYEQAEKLSAQGKRLREFHAGLTALKDQWESQIEPATRERVKVSAPDSTKPHHPQHKGPKKNLRITLANGRVIQRPTAAAALVDAIELLGVDRVRGLDLRLSGVPLVSTEKHPKYGQSPLAGWLVCTHSNTAAKKDLLERIGERLGEQFEVAVIPD